MINPNDITNYHRTEGELQEFLLFCVMCAGKSSTVQAQKLEEFLAPCREAGLTPWEYIRGCSDKVLMRNMKRAKIGKYKLLFDSFRSLSKMLLSRFINDHPTPHSKRYNLTARPAVGIKTASLFLLHSIRDSRMAVLDTHLLKYLRKLYPKARVPKASPQSMVRYMELEDMWLGYCYRNGYDPATHDLDIWKKKAA